MMQKEELTSDTTSKKRKLTAEEEIDREHVDQDAIVDQDMIVGLEEEIVTPTITISSSTGGPATAVEEEIVIVGQRDEIRENALLRNRPYICGGGSCSNVVAVVMLGEEETPCGHCMFCQKCFETYSQIFAQDQVQCPECKALIIDSVILEDREDLICGYCNCSNTKCINLPCKCVSFCLECNDHACCLVCIVHYRERNLTYRVKILLPERE